jgi:hypothetical protein
MFFFFTLNEVQWRFVNRIDAQPVLLFSGPTNYDTKNIFFVLKNIYWLSPVNKSENYKVMFFKQENVL